MVFGDAVNTLLLVLVDHTVGHALEPVVLKNKGTKYGDCLDAIRRAIAHLSTAVSCSAAGSDESTGNVVLRMAGSNVLRRGHGQ